MTKRTKRKFTEMVDANLKKASSMKRKNIPTQLDWWWKNYGKRNFVSELILNRLGFSSIIGDMVSVFHYASLLGEHVYYSFIANNEKIISIVKKEALVPIIIMMHTK